MCKGARNDDCVAGDACATRKLQFGADSIPAAHFHGPVLTLVFALFLLFAGFIGIIELTQRLQFEGATPRVPVYLAAEGGELVQLWPIIVAAVGVVVGTLVGGRVLRRIAETVFRRVVSAIILALGFYMLRKTVTGFTSGG